MQDSSSFFGTIKDDFFEPGSTRSDSLLLNFNGYVIKEILIFFYWQRCYVNIADAVGELFYAFGVNPSLYRVEFLIQIGIVVKSGNQGVPSSYASVVAVNATEPCI